MSNKSAVVLLSGGLDSFVSLVLSKEKLDIKLAIFFNYGQKAFEKELKAVETISKSYDVPYKVVNLDWLRDITTTSLVDRDKKLPEYTLEKLNSNISTLKDSAMAVWVPNRNGVMLNIAASFAEAMCCKYVVFGANTEEASTFPDNSLEFVNKLTKSLSYSTSNAVEVFVPLARKSKSEIVGIALQNNIPLDFVWSCYRSKDKHCGKCESCVRLHRALETNNKTDLWRSISL